VRYRCFFRTKKVSDDNNPRPVKSIAEILLKISFWSRIASLRLHCEFCNCRENNPLHIWKVSCIHLFMELRTNTFKQCCWKMIQKMTEIDFRNFSIFMIPFWSVASWFLDKFAVSHNWENVGAEIVGYCGAVFRKLSELSRERAYLPPKTRRVWLVLNRLGKYRQRFIRYFNIFIVPCYIWVYCRFRFLEFKIRRKLRNQWIRTWKDWNFFSQFGFQFSFFCEFVFMPKFWNARQTYLFDQYFLIEHTVSHFERKSKEIDEGNALCAAFSIN